MYKGVFDINEYLSFYAGKVIAFTEIRSMNLNYKLSFSDYPFMVVGRGRNIVWTLG